MAENFTSDFRISNPRLHRLYVEYAVGDLASIDKAIKILEARSHTCLSGVMVAMFGERKKLIEEDAAFAEAAKLLNIAMSIYAGKELPEETKDESAHVEVVEVTCKHCNAAITQHDDGTWRKSEADGIPDCYTDPKSGDRMHEPK